MNVTAVAILRRISLLTIWVGLAVAPSPAGAGETPLFRALRLEVVQEIIDRGRSADLIGQVLSSDLSCVANRPVIVYFDAADDVLMDETIATLTTDEGGSFFHSHMPATAGEYRAVVEEQAGCAAAESNYTALKMRADITLTANRRFLTRGERVRLTVTVDPPHCQLLDELGVPVADLRIERLDHRDGWIRVQRELEQVENQCIFHVRLRPRRTAVYRAVGEGSFSSLPRYENFFIGNVSTPVLIQVREP
ncbi:MAG TPA: hypothetical protein VEL28_20810 [Candidatus Binatia bacterium]|nr:hypothetical protein [Candidatus Binatia bacterium]